MRENPHRQSDLRVVGASFYQVVIADVLHRWLGESERCIRSVFDSARRDAPCVLFFNEVDELGQRRSALSGSSGMRTAVNALLEELDSAVSVNDASPVPGCGSKPRATSSSPQTTTAAMTNWRNTCAAGRFGNDASRPRPGGRGHCGCRCLHRVRRTTSAHERCCAGCWPNIPAILCC
ncbi:AAA family ATPase [Mycobacterium sp. ML4]